MKLQLLPAAVPPSAKSRLDALCVAVFRVAKKQDKATGNPPASRTMHDDARIAPSPAKLSCLLAY